MRKANGDIVTSRRDGKRYKIIVFTEKDQLYQVRLYDEKTKAATGGFVKLKPADIVPAAAAPKVVPKPAPQVVPPRAAPKVAPKVVPLVAAPKKVPLVAAPRAAPKAAPVVVAAPKVVVKVEPAAPRAAPSAVVVKVEPSSSGFKLEELVYRKGGDTRQYRIKLFDPKTNTFRVRLYDAVKRAEDGPFVVVRPSELMRAPSAVKKEEPPSRELPAGVVEEARKRARGDDSEGGFVVPLERREQAEMDELVAGIVRDRKWSLDQIDNYASDCLDQIEGVRQARLPSMDAQMWLNALVSNRVWSALMERDFCDCYLRMIDGNDAPHPWYVDLVNRQTPNQTRRLPTNVWKRIYEYCVQKQQLLLSGEIGDLFPFGLGRLLAQNNVIMKKHVGRQLLKQFESGPYLVHVELLQHEKNDEREPSITFLFFDRSLPGLLDKPLHLLDTKVEVDVGNITYDDFGIYWTVDFPCQISEPLKLTDAEFRPQNASFTFRTGLFSVKHTTVLSVPPEVEMQYIEWHRLDGNLYGYDLLRTRGLSPLALKYYDEVIAARQEIDRLTDEIDKTRDVAVKSRLFDRQMDARRRLQRTYEILGVLPADFNKAKDAELVSIISRKKAEREQRQRAQKPEQAEEDGDFDRMIDDGDEQGELSEVEKLKEEYTNEGDSFVGVPPDTVLGIALSPTHICISEATCGLTLLIQRDPVTHAPVSVNLANIDKTEDKLSSIPFVFNQGEVRKIPLFHVRTAINADGGFLGWKPVGDNAFAPSLMDGQPQVLFTFVENENRDTAGAHGKYWYGMPPPMYFCGKQQVITFSSETTDPNNRVPADADGEEDDDGEPLEFYELPYFSDMMHCYHLDGGGNLVLESAEEFVTSQSGADTVFVMQHGIFMHIDTSSTPGDVAFDMFKTSRGKKKLELTSRPIPSLSAHARAHPMALEEGEDGPLPYVFTGMFVTFTAYVYLVNHQKDPKLYYFTNFDPKGDKAQLIGRKH